MFLIGDLMKEYNFEDLIETLFWEFDAMRSGYPPFVKYSERDAFKMLLRQHFNEPTKGNQPTEKEN